MAGGVDNTARRKWDKAEFAAKAAAREAKEKEEEDTKNGSKHGSNRARGMVVIREDLRMDNIIARDYKRDLLSRVGTKQIVNTETGAGMGFQCKETGVVLHDSAAYLDHINGKKQMKARGLSMRVERSTVEQVKAKFEQVKKRKAEEAKNGGPVDYGQRLAIAAADDEDARERKKAKEKAKKEAKKKAEEDAMAALHDGIDPDMAAMMGFSGFGK